MSLYLVRRRAPGHSDQQGGGGGRRGGAQPSPPRVQGVPRQRQQREARAGAETAQLLVQGVYGCPGEAQICSGLLQTTCQSLAVPKG